MLELLEDAHFSLDVIFLVSLLQHHLHGTRLFGLLVRRSEHNAILPPVQSGRSFTVVSVKKKLFLDTVYTQIS